MPAITTSNRLRVIVLGYIIRGPLGGLVWHHLQYVIGLRNLGHDVYFVEDSDDYPSCYDPSRHVTDTCPDYGMNFAGDVFASVGLNDCWAYFDHHTNQWLGPCAPTIAEKCRQADIVLNLSGVNPLRHWFDSTPARVLIDTDPLFTQIRHITCTDTLKRAKQHTDFFSFGENIGSTRCTIPDDGFHWRPTRQPVVAEQWPTSPSVPAGNFTTIMQWHSYPALEYDGRLYGMKSLSFDAYIDLPARTNQVLELAIGSSKAPRNTLKQHGWVVRNPLEVAAGPRAYQRYIRGSKGEFSVAKHGYVESYSGWFSERSAAYLTSGRPVIIQDTGFTERLPSGLGVLAFTTPETAIECIDQVANDYEKHCRAARDVARSFFDASAVLSKLLSCITCSDTPLEIPCPSEI